MTPLLRVRDLSVRVPGDVGGITLVDRVDLDVYPGEVHGIAGESGSGKTVTMLAVLGLLPGDAIVEGVAEFDGVDLLSMSGAALRQHRGSRISLVMQDPFSSLHPMLSIETHMTEHLRLHQKIGAGQSRHEARRMLAEVGIPDPQGALSAYPHQFSGGMRQRIAIAMALICSPRLLIADEPTTGLDVTVQAGILRLIDRLRKDYGVAVVLITHDFGVLAALAARVSVLYSGRVVETGSTDQVLRQTRHPYTRALLDSLPDTVSHASPLIPIRGFPAHPHDRPSGCAFHPRCEYSTPSCLAEAPPLTRLDSDGSHSIACPIDPWAPFEELNGP